jgi:hypothetical protein
MRSRNSSCLRRNVAGETMKPDGLKIDRHPIKWVSELINRHEAKSINFGFSRYSYAPRSLVDRRETFYLGRDLISESWLYKELENLQENEELAINSLMKIDGNSRHLPMIDFGVKERKFPSIEALMEIANKFEIKDIKIYYSGRSFHGYGDKFLEENEWIKFMASLLLLNLPGQNRIIDSRWIGHRILGGYSALRWSCNTSQYKRYPVLIGSLAELVGMKEVDDFMMQRDRS